MMTVALGPLIDALSVLRNLHSGMTLAQAQVFLEIVLNPHIQQVKLAETAGLDDSSISRIAALLSNYGSRNTEGLGLIKIDIDENDRRYRTFSLTAKGERVRDQLAKMVGAYYGRKKEG